MNAKAFCYSFEGQKGMVERWVEMRIAWKSAFAQGNHSIRSWFTSRSGDEGTWRVSTVHGLLGEFPDHQFYQREFSTSTRFNSLHSGEVSERYKCVSPVVGIDGKNPKSRAVPGGFTSTCGQEPASSMGQTTRATALTLEDQSGLFQTLGSLKMLIKLPQLCAVTFSPAPAKWFRNQKLAQRRWKHVWLSGIFCLFPFLSFLKTHLNQ